MKCGGIKATNNRGRLEFYSAMFATSAQLSICIALMQARSALAQPTGRSIGVRSHVHITSYAAASIFFLIVFAFFTIVQAVLAFLSVWRRRPMEEDFPRRKLFTTSLLLIALILATNYVLQVLVLLNSGGLTLDTVNFFTVFLIQQFLLPFAETLFLAGLLALLSARASRESYGLDTSKRQGFATLMTILSLTLSATMLILNLAATAVGATGSATKVRTYNNLTHAYLAVFTLTVLVVIISGSKIRRTPSQESHWDPANYFFDQTVIKNIILFIGPIFLARAVFRIIREILEFTPSIRHLVNVEGLELASAIIMGLTFLLAIFGSLNLGYWPKDAQERRRMENVDVVHSS